MYLQYGRNKGTKTKEYQIVNGLILSQFSAKCLLTSFNFCLFVVLFLYECVLCEMFVLKGRKIKKGYTYNQRW